MLTADLSHARLDIMSVELGCFKHNALRIISDSAGGATSGLREST